ncbi:MAG: PqqD family protein [Bacteroidetes bacterium]|nr:PqqD family protein [Bacteroidota bacterium]
MIASEVYKKNPNIHLRKIADEYVLVPVVGNIAEMEALYNLNASGGFVWERLDGIKSIHQIAEEVVEEFDIDHETACRDIIEYMEDIPELIIRVNTEADLIADE